MKYGKFITLGVYLLSLMLLLTPTMTIAVGSGSWPPPGSGDWLINQETIVEDETVILNGNLIVNDTLILVRSTLIFKSNYIVNVTKLGCLKLINSTIKGENSSIRWSMQVHNGGRIIFDNSRLIGVGYNLFSPVIKVGIWINSSNIIINNTEILNAYYGLYLTNNYNVTVMNTFIEANYTSESSQDPRGVFIAESNKITFENVSVISSDNAVVLSSTHNVILEDCNFTATKHASYGMFVKESYNILFTKGSVNSLQGHGATISNVNNLTFYEIGINASITAIDLKQSNNVTISRSIILFSTMAFNFEEASNITIEETIVTNSEYGICATNVTSLYLAKNIIQATDILIEYHNVTNSSSYNNTYISFAESATVYTSNNIAFIRDYFSSINHSAYFAYSENITIENCTLLSLIDNAILLNNVTESRISYSNILAAKSIYVYNTSSMIYLENNFIASIEGIMIEESHDVTIQMNEVTANFSAIILSNSKYSLVKENTITSESLFGMYISLNSDNNVITENTFTNSKSYGLCVMGRNNLIYFNFFINNNNNQSQVQDLSIGNLWDNGSIGNYYCNYDGPDLNHDGIGDEPYIISQFAVDHFPIIIDLDNDSVNDYTEDLLYGTDPTKWDSDDDKLNDGLEIYTIHSLPNNTDTDNDSMPDGWEYNNGLNPVNSSDATLDSDNDGLLNIYEYLNGTNPQNNDTDDDGMSDLFEIQYNLNPNDSSDALMDIDNDGLNNLQEFQNHTDPRDDDTDNDGMPDGWEIINGLNATLNDASKDPDNDGLTNLEEYQQDTDPKDSDTDNDGMMDGWEVHHGLNATINDAEQDPDNDNLTNFEEYLNGTNPKDNDTDDDGLTDGEEVIMYNTNPTKADTDGDGFTDSYEVENNLDPLNQDTDGDGLIDSQDSLPTINNYHLYVGVGSIMAITIIAIAIVYKLKIIKK